MRSRIPGPWQCQSSSPFVKLPEQGCGVSHRTIPPTTSRFSRSVENFRARIQGDLYTIEPNTSEKDLLDKSPCHLLFYHFERPHQELQNKQTTPYQFPKGKWPNVRHLCCSYAPITFDKLPVYPKQLLGELPAKREVLTDHFKNSLFVVRIRGRCGACFAAQLRRRRQGKSKARSGGNTPKLGSGRLCWSAALRACA